MHFRMKSLVTGLVTAMMIAGSLGIAKTATAATPPFEPDPNARGSLTFYDTNGNVVTGGSITGSPIAAYALGSAPGRPADNTATLFGYLAQSTVSDPALWPGEQLSAGNNYPTPTAPAPLANSPNPLYIGATGDVTLAQLQTDFPHPAGDVGTAFDGVYQLRVITSGPTGADGQYWRADIQITGNTWTQIYPPPPAGPQNTTTTLTVTPNSPQPAGTTVNLSAAVTPSGAAGSVQFKDGAANLGSPVPVSGGTATTSTSSLTVGPHILSAVFTSTDSTAFNGSTSNVVPYTISSGTTPVAITTSSLPDATTGGAYSATLAASGGTTPYTWSVSSGSLPAGLTLNANTGAISGTPTTAGSSSFTVMVADSTSPTPQTATKDLSITVNGGGGGGSVTITTSSMPDGTAGTPYSAALQTSGGTGPYTWALTDGSLPEGLTLNPTTGEISGTPNSSAVGTADFTVEVTDSSSPAQMATQDLSITIKKNPNPGNLRIVTRFMDGGQVGHQYSDEVEARRGTKPFMWSIAAGSLPDGLTLSTTTGEIKGTPTKAGTFKFTIKVTDSSSPTQMATQDLSIRIRPRRQSWSWWPFGGLLGLWPRR
jgi:hypothetical protein